MNFSKLVIQLLILIFGLSDQFACATSSNTTTTQKTLIILKRDNANNHKRRPSVPSKQYINCAYNDGHLFLNFTIPEGECICYISDIRNGQTYCYYFDSSELYIDIEIIDIIDFNVEIITEAGNTYCGYIIFD